MSTASMPRALIHPLMLLGLGAIAMVPMAHAASARTVTDVWGGNGNGNIAQGCTTFAPIPDLGSVFNRGGWRVLGGNVACDYFGVTSDQIAGTGSLLTQQNLPPVLLDGTGSTYKGTASAHAGYGSLGVASSGIHTDGQQPAAGTSAPGFVRYVFSVDGALSAPLGQRGSASVQLSIQHGSGQVLDLGRLAVQAGDPGMFSAIDSNPGSWSLGVGKVSGVGVFGSTVHVPFFGDVDLPMTWGSP